MGRTDGAELIRTGQESDQAQPALLAIEERLTQGCNELELTRFHGRFELLY
jgi:hypothetical protein